MKNLIIVIMALLSSVSQAATTGSVTLQGVVLPVVAVTVTGQGTYNTLNLATTQTNLLVTNVQEQSNDALGYKITVASANAGQLKNGTLGQIAYTAQYNAVTFTLSTTAVQLTNQAAQVAVVNVTKPLTISYTGIPAVSLMSGTYSDTLTFTIIAN